MVVSILPPRSIYVDGWFGVSGEDQPNDEMYVGGWFGHSGGGIDPDILARITEIEDYLMEHKPIFINLIGDLEEFDFQPLP